MPVLTKINTNSIADDAVTSAKIPADAVIASDIAAGAVGISELATVTGVTAEYHKVPVFANDSARDAAIGSPAVGMLVYNTDSGAVQQYNGVWSTIAPAPNVTGVSGFLNNDTDCTLTIFGSNFNATSAVKMFTAATGGTQIGSNATTTFNSNSKLTAVFGAGSIGASGSTAYIEVDNSGATNRFATAITVNADPTVTHTGATGTSANTTNHLGTYSGVESEVDSDTKLLLNFDRDGGIDFEDSSNIGRDGHKLDAGGHAVIKASPFRDGKSAMKFDGTDDYLTLAHSSDLDYGDASFTMECWIFLTGNQASHVGIMGQNNAANNAANIICFQATTNRLRWIGPDGSGVDLNPTLTLQNNRWYHLAAVRTGLDAALYVDGKLQGTDTFGSGYGSVTGSGNEFRVGNRRWSGSNYVFAGYIDEVRVVKGVAVYTGDFTVPTSRLTITQSAGTNIAAITGTQTSYLIHSNLSSGLPSTTFTDSAKSRTITASSAPFHSTLYNHPTEGTIVTPAMTWPASGKRSGSVGAYFDGTGDYLYINGAETLIFAGTWSIDLWVNVSSIGNYDGIISFDQTGAADVALGFGTGDSKIHLFSDAGTPTSVVNSVDTISLNTWYHIAVTRDGTTTRFFLNGVVKDTDTSWNGTWTPLSSGDAIIGRWSPTAGGQNFHGYMDLLRISIGAARWTSAFTPPTTLYNGVAAPVAIPTITFTGAATQLAADEDIEFTAVENSGKPDDARSLIDTDLGLTLTNLTGADKNKATLTGTLASPASTTYTNMPLKLQVRKTLGNAAYANASRVVTFSSSTVTTGLAPAMPVSGTGIPAGTTITSVDTSTTITLSANPTGGTLTSQSLIFLDLTRVSHQYNGSDTINNADAMYTLAAGASSGQTLFSARRYMGNGTGLTRITGFGLKPDLVWFKSRDYGSSHEMFDVVRGVGKRLYPDGGGTEGTVTNGVSGFISDGVQLGSSGTGDTYVSDGINGSDRPMICWGWKAGGAPSGELVGTGATMSGTSGAGTIHNNATGVSALTSLTQSVSQTTGLSITKFRGHNDGGAFPHNLGGTPSFIIIKSLGESQTWAVWHPNLTATSGWRLTLNGNNAENSGNYFSSAPSPTTITCGSDDGNGGSGSHDFICYAWKAVAGVSAFGTYSGNGGAQTITYADSNSFTARYIMFKRIEAGGGWVILDKFRDGDGEWTTGIAAETHSAEEILAAWGTTPTSTGFSFDAGTTDSYINNSSGTYLYCAFA